MIRVVLVAAVQQPALQAEADHERCDKLVRQLETKMFGH